MGELARYKLLSTHFRRLLYVLISSYCFILTHYVSHVVPFCHWHLFFCFLPSSSICHSPPRCREASWPRSLSAGTSVCSLWCCAFLATLRWSPNPSVASRLMILQSPLCVRSLEVGKLCTSWCLVNVWCVFVECIALWGTPRILHIKVSLFVMRSVSIICSSGEAFSYGREYQGQVLDFKIWHKICVLERWRYLSCRFKKVQWRNVRLYFWSLSQRKYWLLLHNFALYSINLPVASLQTLWNRKLLFK